jgi:prophage DNA circulation protein
MADPNTINPFGGSAGGISTIRDLAAVSPWRARLLPAHFAGRFFHVEAGSQEGGRRIVTHEFPKKDLPYSEDMGRKATEFTVRGYIVQYPRDTNVNLYRKDYTIARNELQERLDQGGYGTIQLPMMKPMTVVCSRYRMTEEDKVGGYVVFDMTFVELGVPPFRAAPTSQQSLLQESQNMRDQILNAIMVASVNPPAPQRARVIPQFIGGLFERAGLSPNV